MPSTWETVERTGRNAGGDTSLFYGERSPDAINNAPGASSHVVDVGGGGEFLTVSDALNSVALTPNPDGDLIVISPDDYAEAITLLADVSIAGTRNPSVPTEEASLLGPPGGGTSIVTVNDFRVTSTLSSVVIEGGDASQGGGLVITDGTPVIRNVTFDGNHASGSGGAVAVLDDAQPTFEGCIFRNNTADADGGAVYVSTTRSAIFRNCVFLLNGANRGASIFVAGGDVVVDHCIFDRNDASDSGSADLHKFSGAGSLQITYSTVTNSIDGGALVNGSQGSDFIFDCGLVYGMSGAVSTGLTPTRLTEEDPLFCDPLTEDYRFEKTSTLMTSLIGCRENAGMEGPCTAYPVSVEPVMPSRNVLHAPVPNPFNPRTTLEFDLARPGQVSLSLYDLKGRRVAHLLDGESLPQGRHQATWSGIDLRGQRVASGVYFATLSIDDKVVSPVRRLVLLK